MTTLEEHIGDLHTATRELNRITDQAQHIIDEVQEQIQASHVGIPVWLDSQDVKDLESRTWIIGYRKVPERGGAWCLAATQMPTGANEPVMLSHAPRIVRLHAVRLLPALVELLTERATLLTTRLSGIVSDEELLQAEERAETRRRHEEGSQT
jgi:hypothetical protein